MSGFRKSVPANRYTNGSYIQGVWQGDSPTPFTIQASVQPAPDKVRKNLPEGYDIDSAMQLFTDTELHVAQRGSQQSDTVTILGEEYHIVAIERWRNDVIPHYMATAARRTKQT